MSPPSVAFISTWETECGIATYTAGLRRGLEGLGVPCEVLPIDRQALSYLSKVEYRRFWRDMADRAAAYDVVHVQHEFGFFAGSYGHSFSTAVFGQLLADLRGRTTVVVTFHSHPTVLAWRGLPWQKAMTVTAAHLPWKTKIAGEINKGTAAAIAPSRVLRRTLVDSGIKPERVSWIPQGAPPVKVSDPHERAEARRALGYEPDDTVVLMFGFINAHKGHHVALEAIDALPRRFRLAIVGGPHPLSNDGYYETVLTILGERLSLSRRVRLTGYAPHDLVMSYFAAADLCIVPYTERGLATSAAAVWALASGHPVIGSRIPALAEVQEEGRCLRLVSPSAARELAAAIAELEADELAAKVLTTNAATYCEQTAWPTIAARHLELYERERAAGR